MWDQWVEASSKLASMNYLLRNLILYQKEFWPKFDISMIIKCNAIN
jgi:hypothetical protein